MVEVLALFPLFIGIAALGPWFFVLIGVGAVAVWGFFMAIAGVVNLVEWWRSRSPSRETPFGRARCESDPNRGWWRR